MMATDGMWMVNGVLVCCLLHTGVVDEKKMCSAARISNIIEWTDGGGRTNWWWKIAG